MTDFDMILFERECGYDLVEKLREIGGQHHVSPAQVALAWLLPRPFVTSLLVRASKMSQLQENLGVASLELSADELTTLGTLTKPTALYPSWFTGTVSDAQVRTALAQNNG